MTKEQEKAIKYFEDKIKVHKKQIDKLKEEGQFEGNGTMIDIYKLRICMITIILNMLKEKDTEIQKKDKMIDLMAEYISDLDIDEDICKKQSDNNCDDINREVECKECIKQYFERKLEYGR